MIKRNNEYKIGDVIWVKLQGENHIQRGIRPAVIIQNDVGNRYSPTIQVVPLTSKRTKADLPTHVIIPANVGRLKKDSIAQCEGQRPINKSDISGYIGKLPDEYMARISVACIRSTPIIKYLTQDELNTIASGLKS